MVGISQQGSTGTGEQGEEEGEEGQEEDTKTLLIRFNSMDRLIKLKPPDPATSTAPIPSRPGVQKVAYLGFIHARPGRNAMRSSFIPNPSHPAGKKTNETLNAVAKRTPQNNTFKKKKRENRKTQNDPP